MAETTKAQTRHLQKVGAQAEQETDQDAGHQESAHKAEITFAGERIGGQAEEDRAGRAQRHHHQLRAVGQGQVGVQHRPKGQTHEAGQGETLTSPQTLLRSLVVRNSSPK